MTRRIAIFSIPAILILGCLTAQAGPRILSGDDPQAPEIRAVAGAFYAKIAAGDTAGARAMFAGPADQATLLIDEIRLVQSSDKLQKALVTRFGEQARTAISLPADFHARIDSLPAQYIMVNGGAASISNSGLLDSGLDLQHSAAGWSITHLTNRHSVSTPLGKFLTYLADGEDETRRGVEAGTINTLEAVTKDLNPAIQDAMDVWADYAEPPSREQVKRPILPAVKEPSPSLKDIRACFGEKLTSPAAAALIAGFPKTPRVSAFSRAVYIISEESGITLYFSLPSAELVSAHFAGDGREGMSPYMGELPEGLNFWQTRHDVEQKLGPPLLSAGTSQTRYSASYPSLSLQLGYGWCAPKDPDNPLVDVSLNISTSASRDPQPAPPTPRITFRLVVPNARDTAQGVDVLPDGIGSQPGAKLLVSREVLLSERAIAEVTDSPAGPDRKRLGIHLVMTPDGAQRLDQITRANVNHRLAILLDGRVLIAPVIHSAISREVVIEMGEEDAKPGLDNLAGRLHAAVNAIPK